MEQSILELVANMGFPCIVTMYLLVRIEAKFDKLGAFMYSKEDGTPAAKLLGQIHGKTKKSRYNKIMQIQQM